MDKLVKVRFVMIRYLRKREALLQNPYLFSVQRKNLVGTREFIHAEVSRSGLDLCLRRHGVSNLKALIPQNVSII